MDHNDQALWASAQSGDADAFATLFERHMQAVYRFCFWRTADAALSEDLTSAVFLQTWKNKARTDLHADCLLPWLLGVASNLLRNHWRSTRRREAALRRLPPITSESDFTEDATARIDAEATMRSVLAVVNALPERDREVLMMCGWAGLSYAEAGDSLGIPVGTVRSRLAKARARLIALVEPHDPEASRSQARQRNTVGPRKEAGDGT